MKGVERLLSVRYDPDLRSQDTLLFADSWGHIDLLRSFFVGWDGEELDCIQYLQLRGKVYPFSVSGLCLRRNTKRDSFIWSRGKGTWLISEPHQEQIVFWDGLLEVKTGGHQYLDDGKNAVQIMVFMNEDYPLPTSEISSADS